MRSALNPLSMRQAARGATRKVSGACRFDQLNLQAIQGRRSRCMRQERSCKLAGFRGSQSGSPKSLFVPHGVKHGSRVR